MAPSRGPSSRRAAAASVMAPRSSETGSLTALRDSAFSSGTARGPGSCGPGRSAPAPRAPAGGAASAERQAHVGLQLESLGPADDEADVARVEPALLEPARERLRVEDLAVGGEQHPEGADRDPRGHLLVPAHLDQIDLRVAGEHLAVVLHVVLVRGPQPAHGDHGDPHRAAILRACQTKPNATSTSTRIRRRWRAITPTSPTSRTRTTSSRSRSRESTTRSTRARCRAWWCRA